ncbi:Pr6Pr family membrane protein [Agromyces sp. SYSU K20354]|uniref:Pr6Pr family membrane protein n=1 Tax=Agromyces cavernae TaxID=2898659 RepID=UPI001E5AA108|nr:Pr6Pr family membrane protein [Agromyces cavernae]MCD2443250.1 Pr6Pr family membrane protein [Agromyces cavernae]
MRRLFGVLRLFAAVAIIVAIVGQFANSLSMVPDAAAFVVNFFSFFTILSNALAAIVLLIGAVYGLRGAVEPDWYTFARAAIVTYMTTTLVVYNLLLRDISLDQATTVPWSNEILHVWAPLYLLLDWILAPGRSRVPWSRFWWIAAFPIAWVVYTMIRGAVVGWYPYPFLDPAVEPGVGYDGVTVYVIAIASFILLVGSAIVGLSQVRWPYRAADARVDGGESRGERVEA